jgi:predicted secreted protein
MTIGTGIAIYFIIWWIVLFTVLPFGVRTQQEEGEVTPGTEGAAPARPMLVRKALVTTIISGLVFLAFLWLRNSGLKLSDIPLLGAPF